MSYDLKMWFTDGSHVTSTASPDGAATLIFDPSDPHQFGSWHGAYYANINVHAIHPGAMPNGDPATSWTLYDSRGNPVQTVYGTAQFGVPAFIWELITASGTQTPINPNPPFIANSVMVYGLCPVRQIFQYRLVATLHGVVSEGLITINTNAGNKWDQTINFPQPSNKTILDAPFAVNATSSGGGPVTFSIVSGPATIAGNVITVTGLGTVVVRASQAGDAIYYNAATADRSFDVLKAPQIITFDPIPNKLLGDPAFNVFATANTGLPLTYSIVSGPATIAGNTVTLTGVTGTVVVRASQAGNGTYAATTQDAAFTVNRLYTSTQTAYCPFGQTGRPSVGTATSILSQTDADEKAMLNAQQGLVCSVEPPTNATGLTWAQARYLAELGYRVQRAGDADHYFEFDGHLWWIQFYNPTSLVLGDRHIVTDVDFGENEFNAADWKCSGLSPLDLAAALLL